MDMDMDITVDVSIMRCGPSCQATPKTIAGGKDSGGVLKSRPWPFGHELAMTHVCDKDRAIRKSDKYGIDQNLAVANKLRG
jgi:hypothetical protein